MAVNSKRSTLYVYKTKGGMFTIVDVSRHPGNIYWVDSGATLASDASGYGDNPDAPFATIDYAIGQCTASQGDVIYVMPGHAETIAAAAGIAIDKVGVSIIGLGDGTDRPTITYSATASTMTVTAANVTIENILFTNSIDAVVVGIPITAAYCTIRNCEFVDASTYNVVDWFTLSAAGDNALIENCVNTGTATAGNDSFISLAAVSNVRILNCVSQGNFAAANIECTAAVVDLLVEDCKLENANAVDVNIEGYAASTGWLVKNMLHIATDGQITAINTPGAMALFENYQVNNDGETGSVVGTPSVDSGGTVIITKDITCSTIPDDGGGTPLSVPLTGAASGDLVLEELIMQTDSTGLAGATTIQVVCDNVKGLTGATVPIWDEGVASLGANKTINSSGSDVNELPIMLESTKKLYINGDDGVGTGGGVVEVIMKFRRVTADATIAAA